MTKAGCFWLAIACLHNCLSAGLYQPKGESSYCFRRDWWQWQGQAKESRWPHHPGPPVVTSNAWIPETKGERRKQRWALSKRSSQSPRAGASRDRGSAVSGLWQRISAKLLWGGRERGGRDPRWEREQKQHCRVQASRPRPDGKWAESLHVCCLWRVNYETVAEKKWKIMFQAIAVMHRADMFPTGQVLLRKKKRSMICGCEDSTAV